MHTDDHRYTAAVGHTAHTDIVVLDGDVEIILIQQLKAECLVEHCMRKVETQWCTL